jgi:hypothetical protein
MGAHQSNAEMEYKDENIQKAEYQARAPGGVSQSHNHIRSLKVPDLNFHVIASARNDSILAIEPHCGNEVFMGVLYFLFFFSEVQVPDPDGLIVRGRVEVLAVGVDGQAADPVVVACESG